MSLLLKEFWREIVMVLMAVAFFVCIQNRNGVIEERDQTIATLKAEAALNDLQKEALRKAILDQNEAVEKQRIDAEKRAAVFEAESKEIWKRYEAKRKEVVNLSGDVECNAMRSIVNGAVQ